MELRLHSAPPSPRTLLLAAVGGLGVLASVAAMVASCAKPSVEGECEPDGPTECVEVCGGPVVELTCEEPCPPGLMSSYFARCSAEPCGEIVWEGCGGCPEGLFDIENLPNQWTPCVTDCDGDAAEMRCGECPAGSFARSRCVAECAAPIEVCLNHCGGTVLDATCSCADEGLVDRTTCDGADAGADASPDDGGAAPPIDGG